MHIRQFGVTDRAVFLGVVAAYAAGALIILSVLISTAIWPSVAGAF